MEQVSDLVRTFFENYEKSGDGTDPKMIASQYGDTFMFGGPQGVQAVKKDEFLQSLPKREGFFKAAGLTESRIQSLEETRLDENYLMVKVGWNIRFEKHARQPVDAEISTTYVLFQQGSLLQIVFQLDHQDFMKRVQELGLLP